MYTCNQCGYNTKIKCNYIRHLNKKIKCVTIVDSKHINVDPKSIEVVPKSITIDPSSMDVEQRTMNIESVDYHNIDDIFVTCIKCNITLRKKNYKGHSKICKGVPSNYCEFCKQEFKSPSSKSHHKKRCKLNPINMEIKVPTSTSTTEVSTSNIATQIVNNYYVNNSINNSTVNSTVDNSSTNNNNTVNNNNTITFTSFGRENLEHLTSQVMIDPRLNNIRKCYRDTVDLSHFNADHPENHTIRKTNLKSNLIEFRTHQNKWEYESDKAGFRKIRKNLEDKFKTKFDDVDDMTLTAFNEMLYRQTQRGPLPEEEILNKYKSIKYVEAMCDAEVEKQRIKYLDEMELPHDHNIPIYGRQELRVKENELRKTYGLPLKTEIEFVSCTERWRRED